MFPISVELTELPRDELDSSDAERFLDYWVSLRAGRMAPTWGEFDLLQLPLTAVPCCVVVDVHYDPLDFVYRFFGTGHVSAKGREYTGRSATENQPAEVAEAGVRQYERVVEAREPLIFRRIIHSIDRQALPLVQVSVRAPLSDDGDTVTHIVSHADWGGRIQDYRKFYAPNAARTSL